MAQTHDMELIREALRFFVWAAGQGLSPAEGEPAEEPETILFEYSVAVGDEDWDSFPDKIMARIASHDALVKALERVSDRLNPWKF